MTPTGVRRVCILSIGGLTCVLGAVHVLNGQARSHAKTSMDAKSQQLSGIRVLQPSGARPRFSPDGGLIVFDR